MKKGYGTYWTSSREIMYAPLESQRRKVGKGVKGLLKEIMANSFRNMERDLSIQIHEAKRSPQIFNPKQSSPKYM